MDLTSHRQPERELDRERASRDELIERISRATHGKERIEPLPGLWLRRVTAPTEQGHGVSFPAFCVIAQGSKEILLGEKCYRYDPAHYLIATAELPIATRITEASPEQPFLSVVLKLDPALISSVMVEAGHLAPRRQAAVTAIDVSSLDAGLLDAVVRLVRLLDSPTDARFLAPLVTREIVYRLMRGAQGGRFQHLAVLGGVTHRIAEAVERLRTSFDQPLRIEEIAKELGMSVSGFHHHFRSVTAMSPLQFQKHLRLQEARRLMLGEGLDAASAGYHVGYGDASHFTREYKRLFGAPPMHDVERLRKRARENASF
ncbi:MAG: AraC family transcriptional regulator [Chloroflexi bacterium]|nr:AraC family transcriptional regulator [Chloroflexota bacterium]